MGLIMDELIELVLDLLLEGGIEISSNKKVSKWIRCPLTIIFLSFYLVIIALIGAFSINLWPKTLIAAIIFMVIDLLLIIGLILIVKKVVSKQK